MVPHPYIEEYHMSTLIMVAYPDEYRAAEVFAQLQRLKQEYLVDLEEACYVTKNAHGKLKIHHYISATGTGAARGGFWGVLIGLLVFAPILGLAIGAGLGALAGLGLEDDGMTSNLPSN